MAITKGAKKAYRTSERKRIFNLRRQREMKDVVKKVRELVAKGSSADAQALMPTAYKAIDKAAKRGIIKDNTAARKKSRLTALVKRGK